MDFGWAVEQLKSGVPVKRSSWGDSYIFLVKGSEFKVNREPLNVFFENGTPLKYAAHIDIKLSDGSISVWTSTTSAILAEDWVSA
jgi:hypothetical protein